MSGGSWQTVLGIGVLGVSACGAVAAAPSPAQGAPGLTLTLLDPGQEPREALVYDIEPGSHETMTLTMDLDQSFEMDGAIMQRMVMPRMVMQIDFDADEEPAAGTIGAGFRFTGLELQQREGVPPGLIDAVRPQLAGFDTVSGRLVTLSSGRLVEMEILENPATPASVRESLDQTVNALRNAVSPFPTEAVGVGARWRTDMTIPFPGFVMTQSLTYTLEKIEGDLVTLAVDVAQGQPGLQQMHDVEDEWENTISQLRGVGSGRVVLSRRHLAPVHSEITAENTVVVDSAMGEKKSQTVVKTKTHVLTTGG